MNKKYHPLIAPVIDLFALSLFGFAAAHTYFIGHDAVVALLLLILGNTYALSRRFSTSAVYWQTRYELLNRYSHRVLTESHDRIYNAAKGLLNGDDAATHLTILKRELPRSEKIRADHGFKARKK